MAGWGWVSQEQAGDSAAWAGVAEACSVDGRPGGTGLHSLFQALGPHAAHAHMRTIDVGTSSDGSTRLLAQRLKEGLVLIQRDSGAVCVSLPSEHLCLDVSGAPGAGRTSGTGWASPARLVSQR